MSSSSDAFVVSIRWGESPEGPPLEYAFATMEELRAFLRGVDQAIGWLDYDGHIQAPLLPGDPLPVPGG